MTYLVSTKKKGLLPSIVGKIRSANISMDGFARIGFFFSLLLWCGYFPFTKVVSFIVCTFSVWVAKQSLIYMHPSLLFFCIVYCGLQHAVGRVGKERLAVYLLLYYVIPIFALWLALLVFFFVMEVLFWIYENMIITRNGWMSLA